MMEKCECHGCTQYRIAQSASKLDKERAETDAYIEQRNHQKTIERYNVTISDLQKQNLALTERVLELQNKPPAIRPKLTINHIGPAPKRHINSQQKRGC